MHELEPKLFTGRLDIEELKFTKYFLDNITNSRIRNNSTRNLIGSPNSDDITITVNDSVVKGGYGDIRSHMDGNDNFTMLIEEFDKKSIQNKYRVEILFYKNGGEDIVKNGLFNNKSEYGDIVTILGVEKSDVGFLKNYKNNNTEEALTNITALLEDGSSININLSGEENIESELFQINNEIITLGDIDKIELTKINGDFSNNDIKVPSPYKGYIINAHSGDDIVEGGKLQDFITLGPGNDKVYLTPGNDIYYFNRGDGIDEFVFNVLAEYINISLSPSFKSKDIKLYINGVDNSFFLSFSKNEGVRFKDINNMIFYDILERIQLIHKNKTYKLVELVDNLYDENTGEELGRKNEIKKHF